MKYRLLGLLGLLAVTLTFGCSVGSTKGKRGARIERLPKLEVAEPTPKRIQRRLDMLATIEAMKKVEITARVAGIVKILDDKMDIGRQVKAGEVMLVLDVPDLVADHEQKQSMLKLAEKQKRLARDNWDVAVKEVDEGKAEDRKFEADVEFQRSKLARISKLVRERAQDPAVEEEAKRQLESAKSSLQANTARTAKREAKVLASSAEYDVAEQRIKVAQAELKRVTEMVEFATVRAPFDGVITRRSIDPGAVVKDPGAVLFTFMQLDRVRVLIDVPQRDAPLVNAVEQNPNPDGKGDWAAVVIPALGELKNAGRFEGNITRISRSLDPVTRTMRAEIHLVNTKDLDLRPGMFGTATVLVEDRSSVLTVPASALVRRNEGVVEVFVVSDPGPAVNGERRGVLRARPVVVGIDDGKEVEIREGLQPGDLVVARYSGILRPNEAVSAVTPLAPPAPASTATTASR